MICVYKITCPNNRFYLGSAIDFVARKNRHLYDLRRGKHHNSILQRIYNKYGAESLSFSVVEECTTINLQKREEHYIIAADRKLCINLLLSSTFGDTLSQNPNKAKIIAKRSATLRKKIESMSQEERNLTWGRKGESNGSFGKTHNEETKVVCRIAGKIGADIRAKQMKGKSLKEIYGEDRAKVIKEKLSVSTSELQKGESNNFYGRTHKASSNKLNSDKHKGKFNKSQVRPIIIDGVPHLSLMKAAEATRIPFATIAFRVRSKNFTNYSVVTDTAVINQLFKDQSMG